MQSGSAYGNPGDTRLAELAARQHGTVATRQLRALGYSKRAIHDRVAAGRLHRLHRGVYAVGHTRMSMRGRWMAAVLACGPGAVLSHHAAAALWGLRSAPAGPIDVTATSRHDIDGIRCHLAQTIHPDDRTTIDAIPATSIARVLLDLAEILHAQRLRSTLEAAQRADLLNINAVHALIDRSPGRHGLKSLQAAISQLHDEAPWTQSELERAFLELTRHAHLPEPQTNVFVAGQLVDCLWREHNLIVELDGWTFHKTKRAFEGDREKDARLVLADWRVVRLTYKRVRYESESVARDLTLLLGAG
jgi:very-short-patch-repair endonuclease